MGHSMGSARGTVCQRNNILSLNTFERRLKTYFFVKGETPSTVPLWGSAIVAPFSNAITYLLTYLLIWAPKSTAGEQSVSGSAHPSNLFL